MSQTPDIRLGPDDNAPIYDLELRGPNNPDGTPGDVADLTGTTCIFKCQISSGAEAAFTAPVSSIGDPTLGIVRLNFLAMFASVLPFVAGTDYLFRILVTFADGHRASYPNGPDPTAGDGRVIDFYLLRVASDFVAVGP